MAVLSDGGALAESLDGYQPRQSQIDMAAAIEDAIINRDTLVVEAGTGIGKTFAYLAPILLSSDKAIISTNTRQLQDQLFDKDLPAIRKAVPTDFKCVKLKGRSNYLCLHRLEIAERQLAQVSQHDFVAIKTIARWAKDTRDGDIAGLTVLPEDHTVWPKVTSTVENCLGQECDHYSACHVVKARQAAQAANLVVINHHLFCADLTLRETGFAELLPDADTIVIDEAHRMPEVASVFFGKRFSSRQLTELARDARTEVLDAAPDMRELIDAAQAIPDAIARFRSALGLTRQRKAWAEALERDEVRAAMHGLDTSLSTLAENLDVASERSQGLSSCLRRCTQVRDLLAQFGETDDEVIQWFESSRFGFALHATPLDVASKFSEHRTRFDAAWVFTSATLAVDGDFEHYTSRMGLGDALTVQFPSPFDYEANSLLLLPRGFPEPQDAAHTERVCELAGDLIKRHTGGTFLLFTSHKSLRNAAEILRAQGLSPLVQGESPRHKLLGDFAASGCGVLLGTSSFWEGVDVRGAALSCVIIDKLPFASPGDPVLDSRLNLLRRQGRNPFMEYQLPEAVINLKQGAGRLIRDVTDKGLLVICDPRLVSKRYGAAFIRSLPPMPVTDDLEAAMQFLQHQVQDDAHSGI